MIMLLSFFLFVVVLVPSVLSTWDSGDSKNKLPIIDEKIEGGRILQRTDTNAVYDKTEETGYVVLNPRKPFSEQVKVPNTIYEIYNNFNLNGETVTIPYGCTLFFSGGCLNNGTLIGYNTQIKVLDRMPVFSDVIIAGNWNINNIYSEWFNIKDFTNNTANIKNIFALCSDSINNNVYIHKHTSIITGFSEWDPKLSSAGFVVMIPSNTHIHNSATFKVEKNSAKASFPFSFYNVQNCSWRGGILIGDLETHLVDTGEHGFGLSLRGAKNIVIENVTCKDFWGDGINLQFCRDDEARLINCENITISNVICDRNRRQGISIESGDGVIVRNCILRNTGQVRGTAPKFGIDIEPIPGNEGVVTDNILIQNCTFENNAGGGFVFRSITASNIIINNCKVDNRIFWSGKNRFGDSGFIIQNSSLGRVEFTESTEGICLENCTFSHFFGYKTGKEKDNKLKNFTLSNCTLETGNYDYTKWYGALVNLSQFNPNNISGKIDGCSFKVKKDAQINDIVSFKANKNLAIRNSLISSEKDNVSLWCSAVFDNNLIRLSRGYISFTRFGSFCNNTIIYKELVPSAGLVRFCASASIDIIGNKFIAPSKVDQKSLFSRYRGNEKVTINLRDNELPSRLHKNFGINWAKVSSEGNKTKITDYKVY